MLTYLLLFPERDAAEKVAEGLAEDDLGEVRVVREALAGEDDSESHEWGVYVQIHALDDPTGAPARALTERFTAVAEKHDGWLDQHP